MQLTSQLYRDLPTVPSPPLSSYPELAVGPSPSSTPPQTNAAHAQPKMAANVPIQIAETIQTAHINRAPSPDHDLNPTTAASEKEPVTLEPVSSHDDLDDDELDDDIPYSVLNPKPRSAKLPPMPDLRFEQSYLHSISKADTWGRVAWITVRDQVMMPLAQGVIYNLFLIGWHHWNKNAQVHGSSIGARVRRWWYGVNNWKLPPPKRDTWRLRKEL